METECNALKKIITELLEEVADATLLDLIYKILFESTQAAPPKDSPKK